MTSINPELEALDSDNFISPPEMHVFSAFWSLPSYKDDKGFSYSMFFLAASQPLQVEEHDVYRLYPQKRGHSNQVNCFPSHDLSIYINLSAYLFIKLLTKPIYLLPESITQSRVRRAPLSQRQYEVFTSSGYTNPTTTGESSLASLSTNLVCVASNSNSRPCHHVQIAA